MKKFIPLILAAALCLPFAALAEDANEATLFFEVVDVRPLG